MAISLRGQVAPVGENAFDSESAAEVGGLTLGANRVAEEKRPVTPARSLMPRDSRISLTAIGPGDISFTLISGTQLVLDSNSPCVDGPSAAYIGFRLTNTSGGTLTDLESSFDPGSFTLAGGQAAAQYIGTLAAGESRTLYWFIQYPCSFDVTSTVTVTVTDANPGVATGTAMITTRSMISANAGGEIISVVLGGASAVIGQTMTFDVTHEFGNTQIGDEFYLQPSGFPGFDAQCFQLLGVEILTSGVTAIPSGALDSLFFIAGSKQTGSGHQVDVRYLMKYLCSGVSTTASPYSAQTSGANNLKYSGNFDAFFPPAMPVASNPFVIDKIATPNVLPTGGAVEYTVTARNASSVPATPTIDEFVDVLPAGVSFTAISPSSDVTAATSSAVPSPGATGSLRFRSIPNVTYAVPPGDSVRLIYTASVPNVNGSYVNVANSRVGIEIVGTDSATVLVGPVADLSVSKSDDVDPVLAGGTLVYTVIATNAGPTPATGVVVSDSLPAGVTLDSTTVTVGSFAGDTWTVGGLAVGASDTLMLYVSVDPGATGSLSNVAVVTGNEPDPTPANDIATETTTVDTETDLAVTQTDTPDPVTAGDPLVYTVVVTNAGPSAATGVEVSDTLPAGVTLDSTTVTVGSFAGDTWTVDTLAAGASDTLVLYVTVDPTTTGPLSNIAVVTGNETDPAPANDIATETTTVNTETDLAVTQTDTPDPVTAGDPLVYTVVVTNAGPSAATGVEVSDTLPAGVTLDSTTVTVGSFAGDTWTVGALAVGASDTLVLYVTVDPTTTGPLSNIAVVTGNETDPTPANDIASETTTVDAATDLSVAIADSPDPVTAGDPLVYTVVVMNGGPSAATGVEVSDTLPAGVTLDSTTVTVGSFAGDTWTVGSLAAGASDTLVLYVSVDSSATGVLSNVAVVTGNETDPTPANDIATETTTVDTETDLAVTQTDSPDPVTAGDPLVYTVAVTNAGPSAATGVEVSDTLPAGVTLDSTTVTVGSFAGETWTVGNLAAGASDTLVLYVTVDASATGVLSNVAVVTGNETDPTPANDIASETTTVDAETDLGVTQTDSPDPVTAGEPLTYTVVVANAGPSAATGVEVSDTLPAGVTLDSTTVTVGSFVGDTWTVGNLAAGASDTLVLYVTVDSSATGVLSNVAVVTGNETDPTPANDIASETTTVDAATDLSVAIADSSDPVTAGDPLVYTVVVTNAGPSAATGVEVSDTLPGGVTLDSTTVTVGSFAGDTWTVGNLAAGASDTLVLYVTVDSSATGVLSNVAVVTGNETDPTLANDIASETTTVDAATDLSVAIVDSPDPVTAGDPLVYTVVVTNAGPSTATGIEVSDTLPVGVTLDSSTVTVGSFAGDTWTVGNLAAGASDTLVLYVTVDASATGVLSNVAVVTGNETDPTPANDIASETTTVDAETDLSVTQTDSPDPVTAGEPLTYTVVVANAGPSAATGVEVSDTLPAGVTLDSTTVTVGSFAGDTWTVGPLAAGASDTLVLHVTVDSSATGVLSNVAVVAGNEPDPTPANDVATETTTVNAETDLAVTQTDSPDPVTAGDPLVYTVVVTNAGPSAATGVEVSDTLPAGVTLDSTTVTVGSFAGDTWTVGNLAPGASDSLVLYVTADASATGVLSNVAVVTGNESDPTPANDVATETTTVNAESDLAVTQSDSPDPVTAGDPLVYTVVVTNAGPSVATGVEVSDTLPAGVTLDSTTVTVGSFAGDTWTVGTLAAGASDMLVLYVTVDSSATGVLSNVAVVTGNETDPTPANDIASETTTVDAATDLSIAITDSPDPVTAGDPLVYTVVVTNAGPSTATGVEVSDTLPAGVTLDSTTVTVGSFAGDTWTVGTLAAGASDTLVLYVTVDSSATGVLSNVAVVTGNETDPTPANDIASETTTVDAATDLSVAIADSPDPVTAGDPLVYTVVVTNAGPSAATGVEVSDTLPVGVTLDSTTVTVGSFAGDTWTVGSLAAGASDTLVLYVRVDSSATSVLSNVAVVTGNETDPTPANDIASETTTVDVATDLSVAITDSPDPVTAGEPLVYTVVVTNMGPSAATGVEVSDTLPAGVTLDSTTVTVGSFAGDTWTVGTLAAGASDTLVLYVTVDSSATGVLSNVAVVTGNETDPTPGNDIASETTTVDAATDLSVAIADSPDPVTAGEPLTYTVVVANAGPSAATGVGVSDTLPAGVTLDSTTVTAGSFAGDTWTVGNLVAGASDTLVLYVTVDSSATGVLSNVAVVTGNETDPTPANDIASETTTVDAATDLSVAIADSPDPVTAGDPLVYTVVVTNAGPSTATGIEVSDTLPVGVTLDSSTVTVGSFAGDTWTVGNLAAGASDTLVLYVTVDASATGVLSNVAVVTGNESDPTSGNDIASEATTVSGIGTITGLVFDDVNGDGVQQASEPGLAGVDVIVIDSTGVVDTVTTDVDGTYAVTVREGPASVDVDDASLPAGANLTTGNDPQAVNVVGGGTVAADPTAYQFDADLVIVKAGPDSVLAADTVTYAITVRNDGPGTAFDVSVIDSLPAGASFVDASDGGSETGGIVSWPSIPQLAVGDTTLLTLRVVAPTAGTLANIAAGFAGSPDPDPANNDGSGTDGRVTTSVIPAADLSLVKESTPDPFVPGAAITYTLTVSNQGPSPVTSVTLVDDLPAVVLAPSYSPSEGSYDVGTGAWTGLALGAGEDVVLTITGTADPVYADSIVINIATVTGPPGVTDPNSGNNQAIEQNPSDPQVNLGVSIDDGSTSAVPGESISYTIVVTNAGPGAATGALVTDSMPVALENVTWSCVPSSGAVCSDASGAGDISTTVDILPGETVTFTVVATVAPGALGTLTNSVSVQAGAPQADVDPADNSAADANTLTPRADVVVSKTGPADIVAGSAFTYTVTTVNDGPSTATDVIVTDTLPPGVSVVSVSDGGTLSAGVVTWPASSAPVGTSLVYTVDVLAPSTGSLTNIAAASSPTPDSDPSNNDGSSAAGRVTTAVNELADVVVVKSGPANITAGASLTYTIDVVNDGPSAASNVVVTDTLPAGVTVISVSNGGTHVGGVVVWPAIGSLPTAAGVTYTVEVAAPATGTLTNTAASRSDTPDPDPSNNDGSDPTSRAVTTVDESADVRVTKAGPATAVAGAAVTYTVTVSNDGPSAASNVVVVDSLPAGVSVLAVSDGGTHSAGVVTWPTIPSLAVGATVAYAVDVEPTASGTLVNIAASGSATADPDPSNNDGSSPDARTTTAVSAAADLSLTKNSAPDPFVPGDTIVYTLTVRNDGPSTVTAVTLDEDLPVAIQTPVYSPSAGAFDVGTGSWTGLTLNAGDSAVLTITGIVDPVYADSVVTNVATVSPPAGVTDPDLANNQAVEQNPSDPQVDVAVTIDDGQTVATPGSTVIYTITVTNAGPGAAIGVLVTDSLPSAISASSWTCSVTGGGSCASGAGTGAVSTNVDLLPGATATVTVTGAIDPAATGSLTTAVAATVASGQTDTAPANNTDSDVDGLVPEADVAVLKSGAGAVTAGGTLTYTIATSNDGPSTAQGVVVTDTLPAGVTLVSISDGGTESGGVVTWPAIGSLAVGDTVTYTVAVLAAPSGTLVNVAASSATTSDPDPSNNDGSGANNRVSTTVDEEADVVVTKTGPTTAAAGASLTYTVQVSNNGPSAAADVIVTDTLPTGVTVVNISDSGTETNGVVMWPNIATLASGATVVFTLDVLAPPSGTITNVAASESSTPDPDGSNNDGSGASNRVVTAIAEQADLVVTKNGPTSVAAGDSIVYTITVSNDGPSDAADVVVSDILPAGVPVVEISDGGTEVAGVVTWPTIATLSSTASTEYTITILAPASGTIINTATGTSTTGDPDPSNNDGSNQPGRVVTTVSEEADIVLRKTGPSSVIAGDTLTYTITAINNGPSPAAGVVVIDTLPPQVTFLNASTGYTENGNVITWSAAASIASGDSVSYVLRVLAPADGDFTNLAASSSATTDPDPSNNDGTAAGSRVTTTVIEQADVAVSKTGPSTVAAGDTIVYNVTVANNGPSAADDVVVTDTLPAGATLLAMSDSGTETNGVVTWRAIPTLESGASATYTVTALAPDNGPIVNVAAGSASTEDPNPGNNDGSDPTSRVITQITDVDFTISKVHTGDFTVGQEGTYTLTVTNTGTTEATAPVTVTDTLPVGLTFVRGVGAGWTCLDDAQVVTCTFGGTMPANGSAEFDLVVGVSAEAVPSVTNAAFVTSPEDRAPDNDLAVDVPTVVRAGQMLFVEKAASRSAVEEGEFVDYAVNVRNVGPVVVEDVTVTDELPLGLGYAPGTARADGTAIANPTAGAGTSLLFALGDIGPDQVVRLTYRVVVGPGARLGDGINRARASSERTAAESNVAAVGIEFRRNVFTDEGTIIGKVYASGDSGRRMQHPEDLGIPGVRVFLEDGTSTVTDGHGNYHFQGVRPKLHVVRVDVTTLPSGAALVPLTNRHAGNGARQLVDLKRGELYQADFSVMSAGEELRAAIQGRADETGVTRPMVDSLVASGIGLVPSNQVYLDARSATSAGYGGVLPRRTLSNANSRLPERAGPDSPPSIVGRRPSGAIEISLPRDAVPADGNTLIPIDVRVHGGEGEPIAVPLTVTLESTHGRWQVDDLDPREPGVQTSLERLQTRLVLRAPAQLSAGEGRGEIRISHADISSTANLAFQPAPRPLLVSGLLEGRWEFRSRKNSAVFSARDRFDDELRELVIDSEDGRSRASARGALFVKGTIDEDYLLTVRLESEKDDRARFFRDIRPDELYPIYGDESLKEFDAQSRNRFYARVDRDRSYVMYGDYVTPQNSESRALGAYTRSLNGVRKHVETRSVVFDAFASRGRSNQVVDELSGQGVSGPYELSRANGLVNSERVEVLTRDRDDPTQILAIEAQARFVDYTIEPFTGRLVFRRPVPSVDENLNPVSIRVSYETEAGVDEFWTYGAAGQVALHESVELGGSFIRDENDLGSRRIVSGNTAFVVAPNTFVVGELAHTDSAGAMGVAGRAELRHRSVRAGFRAYALWTEESFSNPSSGFRPGRTAFGARGRFAVSDDVRVFAEALRIEDRLTRGRREGVSVSFEHSAGRHFRWEVGFRRSTETTSPASATTAGATPNETTALRVRLSGDVGSKASLFGEFEQDVVETIQRRAAVGGDYRVGSRARVYAQHELISSFVGPFALNTEQFQHSTVLGLSADYARGAQVFSEYRIRNAIGGREAQAAIGLRNQWTVGHGVKLHTSFERMKPIKGAGPNDATAVGVGIEYTRSPRWRGTARAELRSSSTGEQLFGSVGFTRKLSRDWALLGRSTVSVFFNDRVYERSQLGFAWRETARNRWNALLRYEHKFEKDESGTGPTLRREAHVVSTHVSHRASGAWTIRGQAASKLVSDRSNGVETTNDAHLFSLRNTWDLGRRLDLGLIGRSLMTFRKGGRTQYGLGAEIGLRVASGIRVAAGYNVFGLTDQDLTGLSSTEYGFYINLGMMFDEGLFGVNGNPER